MREREDRERAREKRVVERERGARETKTEYGGRNREKGQREGEWGGENERERRRGERVGGEIARESEGSEPVTLRTFPVHVPVCLLELPVGRADPGSVCVWGRFQLSGTHFQSCTVFPTSSFLPLPPLLLLTRKEGRKRR